MLDGHHLQAGNTVFITTNTRSRIPVFSDDGCAREAVETLYRVQEMYPFFLYGFVIMPDHCHLLLRASEKQSLSALMRVYKGGVAHNIGKGPIWQSRFDAKVVTGNLQSVIAYIHQNPVKAGLAHSAEEYPWSSASGKWDITEW